ncbi:putative monocarboxylate permease [Microthyrium microscopicum]|uniref:Putative monocarboxylate permease n=1 Tax=Microthyrium microscopicum TaxID=703497 RepID=A0A6A6TVQ0_9PEZI|nr:putative monocarboxylate permease [Microthyrium microscopicum]
MALESDRKSLDYGTTTDHPESVNSQTDVEKTVVPAVGAINQDFPEGGTRAWSVAFGTSAAIFCTLGYVNSFGVYQTYYSLNQLKDTSPSDIAWIGSLQAFFIFASSLIGGPLFDRYGEQVIRPAAFLYVLSIMMTSICKEYWQFILAQGVLGGVSCGMTMSPAMAVVGHYFNKKRGAAMGLAIAGSSIGGVVLPIALNKMLHNPHLSFGWAVRIIGFIVLALITPAVFVIKARLPPRKSNFFLPRAFKEPGYDFLILSGFFMYMGMFTPIFFIPTYAISQGMSDDLAFYLVAILNAASFPGRVIPGILADKLGRLNMLFVAGISTGILILCWSAVHSNAAIIVFTLVFGFCSGAIISGASVALISVPKDARNIGTYMGMGMALMSIATLIGPPSAGAMELKYHGIKQVSIFSGVVCLVGGVLVIPTKLFSGHSLYSAN